MGFKVSCHFVYNCKHSKKKNKILLSDVTCDLLKMCAMDFYCWAVKLKIVLYSYNQIE
jgi:hypothetical protein